MALISGNALTLGVGIQSAKGTPKSTPDVTLRYTGGFGPTPQRQTVTLAETDANRVQSDPVVVGYRIGGDAEHYIRPSEQHILGHLLLGNTVTTGAGPYVHTQTSTAAGTAPYATLWRIVNAGTEGTKMIDAQISSITWRGGAGQPLSCTVSWVGGGTTTFGVADPAVVSNTDTAMTYAQVTATKNAVHDGSVASFEITANQNRTEFDGDNGLAPFDIAPGLYAVSGSLSMAFQSDADWRLFNTGTTGGTAPTTTLGGQTLSVLASIDSTHQITWSMNSVFITQYEPQHNTDGTPLVANLSFQSAHDSTLANVLSMVVKNAIATP